MKKKAIEMWVFRTLIVSVAIWAASVSTSFAASFQARCQAAGVVLCQGFDTSAAITGGYGDNSGIFPGDAPGNAVPQIDTSISASGGGSLKFTVPANSDANSSGSYFANFSNNLSVQFGANSDFFVQWRQRFSPEFLSLVFAGGGGWKQAIIGTGDQTGGTFQSSCTDLEVVTQNTLLRGFAQMYNSCSGSTSHGAYDPFETPFGAYDFKLQNAMPSPYCLYSQEQTTPVTFFAPTGNCFGYFADEWMTFQVEIQTGPRVNDEFANSYVRLWIARDGKPSQLVMNWGPYNLSAGPAADNQQFGKVWLLPYNTGKSAATAYPVAYTWYDELIVATAKIADPDTSTNVVRPLPPGNVKAKN